MGELSYYTIVIWLILLLLPLKFLKHGEKLETPEPFEIPLVVLFLGFALGLRLVQLTEIPYQLHNDEMSVGIHANEWLKSPRPYLFGASWAGIPQLSYIYSSLGMFLFNDELFGLRITSSFFSVLSLLGGYLFVRLLFGVRAALFFLVLAVPFHWSVHLGRTGHHYVQTAFFYPWALWGFLYSLKNKSYKVAALTGIFTAFALHSYFASRLIVVLQFFLFIIFLIEYKDRKTFFLGLTFVAFLIFSLLPSIYYFASNTDELINRTKGVVVWGENVREHIVHKADSEIWSEILWYQIKRAFGLFHLYGDSSVQYGFNKPFASGILYWPLLIAFLFGLKNILKPAWAAMMLPIILTLFVGGALTIDPPFTPRLAGISALCLAPLAVIISFTKYRPFQLGIGLFLLIFYFQQFNFYFNYYKSSNGENRRDFIARFLNKTPSIKTVINLFPEPEDSEYESYKFLAPDVKFKEQELVVDTESLIVSPKQLRIDSISHGESTRRNRFFWYHVKN